MNSSILRRLLTLQRIADANAPAQVVIRFTDGTATITTPGGAIDILRARGPSGGLQTLHSDHPVFGPWAALLTTLCHAAADRRLSDFE